MAMLERIILDFRKKDAYSSLFGFFGLANIINRPIISIYPHCQSEDLRDLLNRKVAPICPDHVEPCYIMWSYSTLEKAAERSPDHFVVLVK